MAEYQTSGLFKNRETGVYFNYRQSGVSAWAQDHGALHVIDMTHGERFGIVLKTVAKVIVDEDANGNAVWESWPIRIVHDNFEN
jgi:hypothetical protein